MGSDEEGTLAALTAHHNELIEPCIAEHRGRVVKKTGDGLLAEFASVVDATRCAFAFQEGMRQRSTGTTEDKRIEFRVGVNLGDVIVQDDDVFGDGVNVAARLEALAKPGGIALSDDAYRQVRDRMKIAWQDGGEHEVKNIARPVHVWRWAPASSTDPNAATDGAPRPLHDKPSIAVLPFVNMSGDPEQEYFSDGITEDIITALSRIGQFFVISRNTTFTYKGQSADVQVVSKELGVRYVLEGSVRKVGNRVRITAQLIDGNTGNHLWAERYDRELADIFAVQDEITLTVVGAMQSEIGRAEQERARQLPPGSLDAWDAYQRGLWHLNRFSSEFAIEDFSEAQRWLKQAMMIDPSFSSATAALAHSYEIAFIRRLGDSPATSLEKAAELAKRAIALDERDHYAHWILGAIHHFKRDYDSAIDESQIAINLNPSFAPAYSLYGLSIAFGKDPREAAPWLDDAIRLSPKDPWIWLALMGRACAHYFLGEYEKAEEWGRKTLRIPRTAFWVPAIYAATLARLERLDEAHRLIDDLRKRVPGISVAMARETVPFAASQMDKFVSGLRKAGLPE